MGTGAGVFQWRRADMAEPLMFVRCEDGVYRPKDVLTHRFEVRVIYGEGGTVMFRAVIGGRTASSELYYLSKPRASHHAALNEAADWHQARHATLAAATG